MIKFSTKIHSRIMHFKRAPCVDCHASTQVAGVWFACMLFIVKEEDVHVTQYLTGENVFLTKLIFNHSFNTS